MNNQNWTIHSVSIRNITEPNINDFPLYESWLVTEEIDGIITLSVIKTDEVGAKYYASKLGQTHRNQALRRSA